MSRFIPNTNEQKKEMLKELGVNDPCELFCYIPDNIRIKKALNLPGPMSEMDLLRHIKDLASDNGDLDEYVCFLGAGAYDHYIPSIVEQLLSRQEFYTAYTPYQPEVSQGTLQAIFEYQTMICELMGMDVANASMYDGATALVEATVMSCRATGRKGVAVAATVHPEAKKVLRTYARFNDTDILNIGFNDGIVDINELEDKISCETAAVVVQSPNFFGAIEDIRRVSELAHKRGALLIVSVDPISLGILKPPGELGADIVIAEGQCLGSPLCFGGPYLGILAAKKSLLRKMPGRIVGQTTDNKGNRGFVLTIQAREQHIRREKATSNICSNHALSALAATIYLSTMGPKGLGNVARLCAEKAHYTYEKLLKTGKFSPCFSAPFFKEFAVKSHVPVERLNKRLLEKKVIGGYNLKKEFPELDDAWLIAVTETRTKEEIDRFVGLAGEL